MASFFFLIDQILGNTQCLCDEDDLDFELDDDFDVDPDQHHHSHHQPHYTKWSPCSPCQHVFLGFDAGDDNYGDVDDIVGDVTNDHGDGDDVEIRRACRGLNGCKDVNGNLRKPGDSYIGDSTTIKLLENPIPILKLNSKRLMHESMNEWILRVCMELLRLIKIFDENIFDKNIQITNFFCRSGRLQPM